MKCQRSESDERKYLGERVAAHQGLQAKLETGDGYAGSPDWLIGLPGACAGLLELKRRGEEPTPRQLAKLREWTARGHLACWADSRGGIDRFLARLHSGSPPVPRYPLPESVRAMTAEEFKA